MTKNLKKSVYKPVPGISLKSSNSQTSTHFPVSSSQCFPTEFKIVKEEEIAIGNRTKIIVDKQKVTTSNFMVY